MKKIITIVLMALLFTSFVFGQQAVEASDHKIPVVNEHSFPTLVSVPDAFINTSFRANIGIGQTSKLKIPGIRIGEYELFTFEGRLMFVNLQV